MIVNILATLGFIGLCYAAHVHYKRHPEELRNYNPGSTQGSDSWGPL